MYKIKYKMYVNGIYIYIYIYPIHIYGVYFILYMLFEEILRNHLYASLIFFNSF